MKNQQTHITRFLIIVAMALIGCYLGLTAARAAGAGSAYKATPSLPTLRGEAAIGHLKQTGLYHSLSAALMTIDPTFTQQQKLEASDAMGGDQFGFSVAISGETVVVGTALDDGPVDGDSGSAYVFVRSGGVWTQQQKLEASDAVAGQDFGFSVAISGETVVVGAPERSILPSLEGSAYVFVRSGGVWTQQQKLEASDGAFDDFFGNSVAITGETVVVGAPGDDGAAGSAQGSAYVFVRSGGVWSQQQKLEASDAMGGDQFGNSVAISGETFVVGAPGDDGITGNEGSAYVFVLSGGVWTQQQKLEASGGVGGERFGHSVAISGETVVVGAREISAVPSLPGSAYVFVRSGGVWTQQQKLEASDAAVGDEFGYSVAISGETIVVGAWRDDGAAGISQGSAYVFVHSGGVWTQQQKLEASDAGDSDGFGSSVAIGGETVVVGAWRDDRQLSWENQGSAYVFAPAN
jgi:hypothetical protein